MYLYKNLIRLKKHSTNEATKVGLNHAARTAYFFSSTDILPLHRGDSTNRDELRKT